MNRCGGCEGKGSHRRWCPAVVGHGAAHWGSLSMHTDDIADQVGGNNPGLANTLYAAAAELRTMAEGAKR